MTKTTPTLEGQTILVVGGSSGIGYGVALAALNDGAATVIIASSSSEKVHKACERLKAQATDRKKDSVIKGAVIDGKDLEGVDKVMKEIGTINHLIWTSGDFTKSVSDMLKGGGSSELQDRGMFDVRFWGAVQAAKSATFAPGGSVVFTGGAAYNNPIPGFALGAAVTSAVVGITKGLAVDMAPAVRVNCVAPGMIETEFFDDASQEFKEGMFKGASARTLVKRVGQPEDTAEAYLFLMKCGYITAETINVNGGLGL